ncbi:DHH family phosphoesterase [Pelotomaculum propionicicum]|uniref:Bifunctional oligoribonuclease and PAP phosphatase NrnA n=1 Tax=Pelotomaculum propionicicum TaxID=258475 RepID=A0A4Y7RMX8_9FIRM|nr:bifunctional oligoribonuclease/PAP phosphatase NrnA [Pelotomaculum propionicicum]NLI11969.1 bifunctional oligoribonuclease/PAP phosphatase NrnA [Peptococcaceae bacterium]TEB10181.1 Bifunctional oligoribonuclease and PAP phosphatase NrnA [Pelotomaculum propionicicum]
MNNLADIALAIDRADSVLICGHVLPDGDSLGSMLALGLALEKLGKKVTMGGADRVPAIYGFLPGVDRYVEGAPPAGEYDTFIVLDCSVPERLGKGYQEMLSSGVVVINLDHHAGSKSFGTYRYIDPAAAAVGEIIFDLFNLMKVDISLESAICLYTAIVTDTGSFQYENMQPDTHRRVAELLELGVPAAQINQELYEEKPKAVLDLLGLALGTLSLSPCGRVCWMTVTRKLLNISGAEDEHTEGLVNYARSIRGVQVGILFRETEGGDFKISFRSKGTVDVNRLSAMFGGGGHPRASGCVMSGNLADIQEKIVSAAVLAAGGINN